MYSCPGTDIVLFILHNEKCIGILPMGRYGIFCLWTVLEFFPISGCEDICPLTNVESYSVFFPPLTGMCAFSYGEVCELFLMVYCVEFYPLVGEEAFLMDRCMSPCPWISVCGLHDREVLEHLPILNYVGFPLNMFWRFFTLDRCGNLCPWTGV